MKKNKKKNILFAIGCVTLAIMLTFSTYISLVVFGVISEENKKGESVQQNEGSNSVVNADSSFTVIETTPDGVIVDGTVASGDNNTADNTDANNNYVQTDDSIGTGDGGSQGNNNAQSQKPVTPTPDESIFYLDTNKSAKQVIDIYAELMDNAKTLKPGFIKIEYQDLPGDAQNRVVTEGAESIETVFGFVKSLGLIVDEQTAKNEPYIHQKGDEMTKFPVFDRAKGSYLTDPKGVKSYTYQKDKNGNIKLTFTLVDEINPEPIAENSNTAPSYTGAVFSPMSKEKIDNTVNHPIVTAFAKNIKYSLTYHDCRVEMVFNPENGQIISLNHFAYVRLSGSGDVIGGRMDLKKQELVTAVLINDFKY